MLKIPAFSHPSNKTLVSTFKQPNIEDAMSFLELDPDFEEKVLTDYLNHLLISTNAGENSLTWTAQDRKTALWWIFINIMPDTELTFSYECEHCGGMHIVDYSLLDLDAEISTFDALPELERYLSFGGRKMLVKSQPLTGEGAQMLESYSVDLAEAQEAQEHQREQAIKAQMKILDAALHVDIEGADLDKRLEQINTLTIPEMMRFFHFAEQIKQELHHGLHTQLENGRYKVVSTPLPCEEKEEKSTRMLIDFRCHNFIPAV